MGELGYAHAVTGRRAEAFQILKELEERYSRRQAIGFHLATIYMALGDKDRAFLRLERDFEERNSVLAHITHWHAWDDARSDPRYTDLVRRMGLQP